MAEKQNMGVAPQVWQRLFQGDPDGVAVLEELTGLFVDGELFASDPLVMARNIGKRDLVMYLIRKSTGG